LSVPLIDIPMTPWDRESSSSHKDIVMVHELTLKTNVVRTVVMWNAWSVVLIWKEHEVSGHFCAISTPAPRAVKKSFNGWLVEFVNPCWSLDLGSVTERIGKAFTHPVVIEIHSELTSWRSGIIVVLNDSDLPFACSPFRMEGGVESLEEPTGVVSVESDIGVHGYSTITGPSPLTFHEKFHVIGIRKILKVENFCQVGLVMSSQGSEFTVDVFSSSPLIG
jgi:hypothetical protein